MEKLTVVITGPTASGKTLLSIKLAQTLESEIISADSRQVFKFLSIGTAKPGINETKGIKHYFIDELNPDENFNASIFEIQALKIIEDMLHRGKTPIVVGGSGLYISALVNGIFDVANADEKLRQKYLAIKAEKGIEFLYDELKIKDHESAQKMLPQNWKRVMRALEVLEITGRPIWQAQNEYKRHTDIKFLQYGLNWEREVLYNRINKRVDLMIEQGLVEETRKALSLGYDKNLNALNTVGYKEIIAYLEGSISLDEAIELIKRNSRRFAKRQMTWFRRDERIKWFNITQPDDIEKAAEIILKQVKENS